MRAARAAGDTLRRYHLLEGSVPLSLVMAAALKLGETLVKAAFTAITGQPIAGDMAAGLASVLGDNALGKVDARRASRLMTDIADTAAEHIAGTYEHEFRGLSESERAVVINAVADTFARVPTTEMAFAADFDARKFEQHVRNLTSEYLRSWYFGQDETEFQPDTPAVLCRGDWHRPGSVRSREPSRARGTYPTDQPEPRCLGSASACAK